MRTIYTYIHIQKWNEIEIANVVSRIGEINTSAAYYIAIFDIDKSDCHVVKNKLEENSLMCKIVALVMPEHQNGKSYVCIRM